MCRSYKPPDWLSPVCAVLTFFIFCLSIAALGIWDGIRTAEQRTRPQIVEEPDPDTAEDALPQSYVTG